MKSSVTFLALSVLPTAPAIAQDIVGRDDDVFTLSEAVREGSWVRIASPNGAISIAEAGGNRVEIRATKEIRRGSIEDIGFVVRREDGGLTICAVYDDPDECDEEGNYRGRWRRPRRHEGRVDFTVRIPEGVSVKAGSGNGDVAITGAGAEVIASTGNGRVDVSRTTGEVKASTGNGRVTIEGAEGRVQASSGNGAIRVATSIGPVSANTGNGDIEVSIGKLDRSPDMSFSTGNGRVEILLPEGFGAEVDASTGSGHVEADFPIRVRGRLDPKRLRGIIGDGGGRLAINSGNGDVVIRQQQ